MNHFKHIATLAFACTAMLLAAAPRAEQDDRSRAIAMVRNDFKAKGQAGRRG